VSQCAKLHVAGWTWAVFTRVLWRLLWVFTASVRNILDPSSYRPTLEFLGAFGKYCGKRILDSLYVCPSVYIEQLSSHKTDLTRFDDCLSIFRKPVEGVPISINTLTMNDL
jgi:hypothetical protein